MELEVVERGDGIEVRDPASGNGILSLERTVAPATMGKLVAPSAAVVGALGQSLTGVAGFVQLAANQAQGLRVVFPPDVQAKLARAPST